MFVQWHINWIFLRSCIKVTETSILVMQKPHICCLEKNNNQRTVIDLTEKVQTIKEQIKKM